MDSISDLYGLASDDPAENVRPRAAHAKLRLVVRGVSVENRHALEGSFAVLILRYEDARQLQASHRTHCHCRSRRPPPIDMPKFPEKASPAAIAYKNRVVQRVAQKSREHVADSSTWD